MDENLKQSIQAKREMLAQWRASRTHELTLPSGLPVQVRDATIMDLAINGDVPQTLMEMIIGQAQGNGKVDLTEFSSDKEFGKLINEMVKICVVDPPVAEIADDDHLGLNELSGADKMAIFEFANREVTQVKTFRDGQTEPVSAALSG